MPRAALVRRLLASDAPIVAVVAPAGYGKTTLLGQWMEAGQPRQAWVSLDARDNDPGTLLSYLATALDRLEPMEPTVLRSLTAPGSVDLAAGGHRLAVAASSMRTPFTMALDHVEAIQNPSCRDTIAELALGLPAGSRLGLASRTEPPIPMPQLRARGQVVEVTTDDLAMDELEARQLLETATAGARRGGLPGAHAAHRGVAGRAVPGHAGGRRGQRRRRRSRGSPCTGTTASWRTTSAPR